MSQELEQLKMAWLGLNARVEQLAAEHQQYLEFFENAGAAYVVTTADGRIVEANGAAVDVLQRRKRYLRGKPFAVLIALERRAEFRNRLTSIAAGEAAERSWRTVLAAGDERVGVEITARIIGEPGGGICWRLAAVQ